jgi:uncharacterized protein (TIGR02757 family)
MAFKKTNSQKIILDLYEEFHHPKFLEWDPLVVARRYQGHQDIELVSLISALFAFGGVKQIIASVDRALTSLNSPREGIVDYLLSEKNEAKLSEDLLLRLKGFRHRIYVDRDLVMLLLLYRKSLQQYGNLEKHFLFHHSVGAQNVEAGLGGIVRDYRENLKKIAFTPGKFFNHMLNSPEQKSACKRWVMFLKWMVRADDGIDLGLWKQSDTLKTNHLIIPIDTHLFKISKRLKLTNRKTPNWLTAVEVTEGLKEIDPLDPTRFDFSLCRYGMFQYRNAKK